MFPGNISPSVRCQWCLQIKNVFNLNLKTTDEGTRGYTGQKAPGGLVSEQLSECRILKLNLSSTYDTLKML